MQQLGGAKMTGAPAPTYKVYVGAERTKPGGKKEHFWHRVGSGWNHDDGKGLNVLLPPGLALFGKVVIRAESGETDQKNGEPEPVSWSTCSMGLFGQALMVSAATGLPPWWEISRACSAAQIGVSPSQSWTYVQTRLDINGRTVMALKSWQTWRRTLTAAAIRFSRACGRRYGRH